MPSNSLDCRVIEQIAKRHEDFLNTTDMDSSILVANVTFEARLNKDMRPYGMSDDKQLAIICLHHCFAPARNDKLQLTEIINWLSKSLCWMSEQDITTSHPVVTIHNPSFGDPALRKRWLELQKRIYGHLAATLEQSVLKDEERQHASHGLTSAS